MGIYRWYGIWISTSGSCITTGNPEVTSRLWTTYRYTCLFVNDSVFLFVIQRKERNTGICLSIYLTTPCSGSPINPAPADGGRYPLMNITIDGYSEIGK
jgi:hypothetical protein